MERNNLLRGFLIIFTAFLLISAIPVVRINFPALQPLLRDYDTWVDALWAYKPAADSLAQADTAMPALDTAGSHLDSVTLARIEEMTPEQIRSYAGQEFLAAFHEALHRVRKGGKARIAWFGDSMIEGDLITQSVRNTLQKQFGGVGVGFVPLTSVTGHFRQTIAHDVSPQTWLLSSFVNPKKKQPYGFNGEYHTVKNWPKEKEPLPWISYKASKLYPGVRSLTRPSLLFGAMLPDSARKDSTPPNWRDYVVVQRDNGSSDTLDLRPTGALHELSLADTAQQSLKLNFHIRPGLPIYGANFEGGSGVYLDNFGSRGNTGIPLGSLRSSLLMATQARFNYNLVVLQFGLNMIDSTRTNYQLYQRDLVRVINHIKANMPGVAILVVSVGDKASKIDGRLHTDPCVPRILAAQRNAAIETGSAFFNLYEGMGGYNSMLKWVQGPPILANKDYTHPNHSGAQKIADMIYAFLMAGYTE